VSVGAAELKSFARDKLAPYKVPSKYEFVTELPKTQIGKVLYRVLRQTEDKSVDPDAVATTTA
jgi:long-chain acyl-CoA synthetase